MGFFNRLANTVYPAKCIFCRQIMNDDAGLHICSTCYEKLPFMTEAFLDTAQNKGTGYCDGVMSIFHYTGIVKESLIRFKFQNKPGYYRTYARLIAGRLAGMSDITQYDMVLSVPLHRKRELSRGYNQALLISRFIGRELKIPERSKFLKRLKQTEAQSLLDGQKRHENVQGAFIVTAPEKVGGKSILLVDDIMTTGSTLEECSRVLKQAGAAKIIALVVATGRKQ
ncbi:MAG: ComF family protein [Clostridiaceae bacterium]